MIRVWADYDQPREMEGLTGPVYSGYIWKGFMDTMGENQAEMCCMKNLAEKRKKMKKSC